MEQRNRNAVFEAQMTLQELLDEKERDMRETPGFAAKFSPEEAEVAGAFVEDALPLDEADAFDGVQG